MNPVSGLIFLLSQLLISFSISPALILHKSWICSQNSAFRNPRGMQGSSLLRFTVSSVKRLVCSVN
jgi:hypothetical protein